MEISENDDFFCEKHLLFVFLYLFSIIIYLSYYISITFHRYHFFIAFGCKSLCARPLGMASYAITDGQLSASSNNDQVGSARPSHPTGWCTALREPDRPWFRVDLPHVMRVTRVMATGSNIDTYISKLKR